jgi:phosphoglycolate phosphatase
MVLTYPTILLDLDGTLVDSAPGIVSTIAHTLTTMGEPVPPVEDLMRWVGPPLPESFERRAGLNPERVLEAIAIYRAQYLDHGAYDSRVFDGMGEFLVHAKNAGAYLAVATSKPTTPAMLTLEHFTLARHFDVIACAADDESRGEKHEIIGDALHGLREKGIPTDNVIMVGDRIHDVEGAEIHGIDTIMVRWGYGGPPEWAQAHRVVDNPGQLHEALGVPGAAR